MIDQCELQGELFTCRSDQEPRVWSGRRDSNPRHPAWKASAPPTELLPLAESRRASCERPDAVAVRADDIALGCLGQDVRRSRPADQSRDALIWNSAHGGRSPSRTAGTGRRNRRTARRADRSSTGRAIANWRVCDRYMGKYRSTPAVPPQSWHGTGGDPRRNSSVATWRERTRAISRSRFLA